MSEETSYTPAVESSSDASYAILDSVLSAQREATRLRDELRAQRWQNTRERNEVWQREVEQRLHSLATGSSTLSRSDKNGSRDIMAVQTMCTVLEQENIFGALARSQHGEEISRLLTQSRKWEKMLRMTPGNPTILSEAKQAATRLQAIREGIHNKLALAEEKVAHRLLTQSLTNLGYSVEQLASGLRATSGRTCVWAQVKPGSGDLHLDMSGFSGLECQDALQGIQKEMTRHGLSLRRLSGTTHGRPEGGGLAQVLGAGVNHGRQSASVFTRQAAVSTNKASKPTPLATFTREKVRI